MSTDYVVLVVDDDAGMREVLLDSLTMAGYQTREADSSIAASRFLGQERIDAVILDLRMPRLSGFDLLEWLRTEPLQRSKGIPVLILTGQPLTQSEAAMLRRHHARVFFKPDGVRELLDSLENIVRRVRLSS